MINKISPRIDLTRLDIGGKIPPQAVDIEEGVLGAILIEPSSFEKTMILKPEYFYVDNHQYIYECCVELYQGNNPIDIMTVTEQLKKKGYLDIIGGPYLLASLSRKISSISHIEYHSAIIAQKFNLREIIRVSMTAANEAYNDTADPFEIQATMFNELEKTQFRSGREPAKLQDVASENIIKLDTIQKAENFITGINTGFIKINENTHGWHSPDLVIIAARPSTGKTAFALNIAYNVVIQDIPCAFFSLEMSKSQLVNRLISMSSGVFATKLRNADLDKYDWERIHGARYNMPLYIDDTPALSLQEFKAKARKLKRKSGIKMIVIDYLQLMVANVKGNREQEISTISRSLKAIAKELDIPIIALAQLSRDVEKRQGEPRLSDLRESGAIEQDADIIVFLHDKNAHDKTITVPIITATWAKHRDGACVEIDLEFNKPIQKFKDAPVF